MISLSEYQQTLIGKFIPAAIIATRPDTPDRRNSRTGWCTGADRDLLHNCWKFQIADTSKRRKGATQIVSFDVPIDFPCLNLADEACTSDRLTKKLLILSCATTGPRDFGDIDYLEQVSVKFDWMTRYRRARGLTGYSMISRHFARQFAARASRGGVLYLVPMANRLEHLVAEHARGAWSIPFKDGRVDWPRLAADFGATLASVTRSTSLRNALIEAFPEMTSALAKKPRHSRAWKKSPQSSADLEDEVLTDAEELLESTAGDPEEVDHEVHDDEVAGKAEDVIRSDNPVRVNMRGYLEILEFLYRMPDLHHDSVVDDPFVEISLDRLVEKFGKDPGRTPTLLPEDMLRVMVVAARWVVSYGPYVAACYREFMTARTSDRAPRPHKAFTAIPTGAPIVKLAWSYGQSKNRRPNELLLGQALRYLLAACAILVASFAARRNVGVSSLHLGCLFEDAPGLHRMTLYIAKTKQDYVDVPVPSIMKMVVSVLEEVSEYTRAVKSSHWLFEVLFDEGNPNRLISLGFFETLSELVIYSGIYPPQGQETWDLAMHQLRRGYGIWYYFGLPGGSVDALSLMYQHNDPRTTRIYFTLVLPGEINRVQSELDSRRMLAARNRTAQDQDWIVAQEKRLSFLKNHQQSFNEPRCEKFVERMFAVWKGTASVIGAAGKALYNDIQAIAVRAMASVRIGSRVNDPSAVIAPLLERLLQYARENFLEPVIGTNMWCMAHPRNPEHLAAAACLKRKGRLQSPWSPEGRPPDLMPDFDLAANSICIGCRFCAAFDDGQAALERDARDLEMMSVKAATPALREEVRLRLVELEQAILTAGPPMRGVS